jgi:hypothetical protein
MNSILAKVHMVFHQACGSTLPLKFFETGQIIEAREDGIDTIVLPAEGILSVLHLFLNGRALREAVV